MYLVQWWREGRWRTLNMCNSDLEALSIIHDEYADLKDRYRFRIAPYGKSVISFGDYKK